MSEFSSHTVCMWKSSPTFSGICSSILTNVAYVAMSRSCTVITLSLHAYNCWGSSSHFNPVRRTWNLPKYEHCFLIETDSAMKWNESHTSTKHTPQHLQLCDTTKKVHSRCLSRGILLWRALKPMSFPFHWWNNNNTDRFFYTGISYVPRKDLVRITFQYLTSTSNRL